MRSDEPQQTGTVTELLPSAQYRVRIADRELRCYAAGKMRLNKIKVVVGDRVSVIVSGDVGRITRRL